MGGERKKKPIIDWKDSDVWDFYWHECKKHNPLYSMGYFRVGCVGCPLSGKQRRKKEFKDFPTYERAYKRAFDRMLCARAERASKTNKEFKNCMWKNADEVFRWWIEDDDIVGQLSMFGGEGEN